MVDKGLTLLADFVWTPEGRDVADDDIDDTRAVREAAGTAGGPIDVL